MTLIALLIGLTGLLAVQVWRGYQEEKRRARERALAAIRDFVASPELQAGLLRLAETMKAVGVAAESVSVKYGDLFDAWRKAGIDGGA